MKRRTFFGFMGGAAVVGTVPKCTSWRGHKFEGRYSEKQGRAPTSEELVFAGWENGKALIRASIQKSYERDICVRCGYVIEKRKRLPE